jgi:hypothetical protein
VVLRWFTGMSKCLHVPLEGWDRAEVTQAAQPVRSDETSRSTYVVCICILPTTSYPSTPYQPGYHCCLPTSLMGKLGTAVGTPIPPPYSTTIGCLQLSRNDHLRLINLPPDLIQVARQTILETWPKGIQKEGDFEGCAWEFKLKGNPCE